MGRFDALSDIDFEDFVADLMSEVTGLEFVAGIRGRDKGIDCLAVVDGERHVIQCKHFIRSRYPKLKSKAREEANRLADLDHPLASYRFVTSLELSHDQRNELVEILEPSVGSRDNVFGGKELGAYLGKHAAVEARHPKLWFSGVGQLRGVLSAASYERSRALLEETRGQLPRYVQTQALKKARDLLYDKGVVVVAGPPGVGKTILARLLVVESLENGFQPFEIVPGGLGDAWELLELDEKQIFYFDDFLGRTALYESRERDQDLMRFIGRIADDPERRLVLISRDYILNQARKESETLAEGEGRQRYSLTAEQYTRNERARILYNHLYFSDEVGPAAKRALVSEKRYLQIIDHRSYNPRVIEWVTGFSGPPLTAEDREDYGRFCMESLDSPERLWSHAFERGLGEHEKALLFTFLGLSPRVTEDNLETAFDAACAARGLPVTGRQFHHALAILGGSFVAATPPGADLRFSLLNPSLLDFLKAYVTTSAADAEAVLRGACFFGQVQWLWGAFQEKSTGPAPERLQTLFGEAFLRTLDSPIVENRFFYLDGRPSELDERLSVVVGFCERNPGFSESLASGLQVHLQRWLGELERPFALEEDELSLLRRLVEQGMLDRAKIAGEVAPSLFALPPVLERWHLIDAFHRLMPEEVSAADKASERAELEQFIDSALDAPREILFSTENLDELTALADSWSIELDADILGRVRLGLEGDDDEYFEMEDGEGETDADAPDNESNEDITAMFMRLLDLDDGTAAVEELSE